MKKYLILSFLVVALSAGRLSAAVVACPTTTTLSTLLAFDTLANACYSQDKLFWNFSYTPTGNSPAAADVSASLVFQAGQSIDIHGWNFGAVWSQNTVTGTPAGFTLSYSIEVCPTSGLPCSGNVLPGTLITQADAVYAPSSVFLPGPETVTWSNGASVTLTSGAPGPLPPGGNIGLGGGTTGPITVTAQFSGTGAITQTTLRFYETIGESRIPEPTTLSLIGAGLIALGCVRVRRRRAH
jgi:hypothetical protein